MIQIEEAFITRVSLQRVCPSENKVLPCEEIPDFSEQADLLKKLFLKPFLSHTATFEFGHRIGLEYNVLFNEIRAIAQDEDFNSHAENIAQHLLEVSKHPNIKDSDFFIVRFADIQVGQKHYEAIGLYKFEEKENYMDTGAGGEKATLHFRKGLNGKKPEKACLVVLTEEPYTLFTIDGKDAGTEYWQEEFIGQNPKDDFVNHTADFLLRTKSFITDQVPQEYEVTRSEQLNLLNRSMEYFKSHETFDREEFESEVFQHNDIIKSFRNFDNSWHEEQGTEAADRFEIAAQVVKKQARVFKSVLKLDKNFHIYIHGDRDLIEQGTDRDGRKYYKIYYDNES